MRSFFIFLFFFVRLSLFAADSTGIVRGRVTDLNTGDPLVSATIIFGRSQGAITDNEGNFFFRTTAGHIQATFQYVGYKSVTKHFLLNEGETIELNIELEYEIAEIDQIVISANKAEQRMSELTVSLSIIKPSSFYSSHINDTKEILNKSSGIEILDGQASIRGGSGYSYGAGSRVMALIDGLPVIATDAGNIKWQFLPVENLSQIEIIKGASSVLYGSSALNGIINFRTADATALPVTTFYAETGIFDKPREKNRIWWDSPRMFSNASFSHSKKYGNTEFSVSSGLRADNGYRRLNDEKLGRLSIKLKHHDRKIDGLAYGMNLNGGITEKTDFILWEDALTGALKQSETSAIELQGSFAALDPFIQYAKDDRTRHELKTRIQLSRNHFPSAGQNNSTAFSVYNDYLFWKMLNDHISVNTGLTQTSSYIISEFYGNHKANNLAGYTQADAELLRRLKMTAGFRIEMNALDGEFDRLVPLFRTGINYKLFSYTFIRASFGQGYRYPSIAEKHAATTIGSVRIFPNHNILPESGWNSELGVKQGFLTSSLNGQADLALFYSQNKDMIEYVFGIYQDHLTKNYDFGFKATNIEHSRVYGLETEVLFHFKLRNADNTINGGYVFMYPVEFNPVTNKNTDVFLKFRRKHSGKISFNSRYNKFEWGISLFAKSGILNIDDVFLNELTRENILPGFYNYWNNNSSGYLLLDGNIGYNITGKYKLSIALKNITNKEFMGRPGDIQPHRNLSLRFTGRL